MAAKVKFGLQQKRQPTPPRLEIAFKVTKRLCMVGAGSGIVLSHEYISLGLMAISAVIDEIEPYFGITHESEFNNTEPDSD